MKRTLSLLLVLVMVVSMMALAVSAEDVAVAVGASETVSIAAGSSANVVVDATASDLTVIVSGGRSFWDWYVQAGRQQVYPNPGGFAEITLPAGETYTLVLNNTNTEAAGELTVTVEGPAEVGSEKNPEVVSLFSLGEVSCYLMNTQLEAGDEDGYWYTFAAEKDGIIYVETSSEDAYTVDLITDNTYRGSYEGNPIISYPVVAGENVKVHVSAEPNMNVYPWEYPAAYVYVSAFYGIGNVENPIGVKDQTGVSVPVGGGSSLAIVDGSNAGYMTGKGLEISCWDISSTTVEVYLNGELQQTVKDFDGDGKIELTLNDSHTVRSVLKITNEGWNTAYTINYVEAADEDHCPNCDVHVLHVAAKDATCFEPGNLEYWYCPNEENCGLVFIDNTYTQISTHNSMTLPVSHNIEHVEGKAATCDEPGNIEYWYCTDCGYAWLDEYCNANTNLQAVVLPITHNIEHVEAKEMTCFEPGNIEYWYCKDCGGAWLDEYLHLNTNLKSVIVPIVHNLEHVEAKEMTCFEPGNVEYWYCKDCGFAWTDENLREQTNLNNVVVPIIHNIEHVEAKEMTCDEEGNIEYWYCKDCGYAWTDELLRNPTNLKSVIIPISHNVDHVEAVTPSCHIDGNIEYWYCMDCGAAWLDEYLHLNTNLKSVVLPKSGDNSKVVHVEAVEPGCFNEGNIEHWYCEACELFWQDEDLTQITNAKRVMLPVTHTVKHVEAVEPGCFNEGNIEYWYCTNEECGLHWANEGQTQVTNSKNVILPITHSIEHVEAVDATCHDDGNLEHWYCEDCGFVWLDEYLIYNSNMKAVILPATGAENMEHYEAVEPDHACHDRGWVEHWVCEDCDRYFLDEEGTQLTNALSIYVGLEGSENLKHVEAKDPTTEAEGNVEYWYCPDCDRYFLDENCTQLTNAKNVIIAKVSTPVTGDNTSIVVLAAAMIISVMGIAAVVFTKKRAA